MAGYYNLGHNMSENQHVRGPTHPDLWCAEVGQVRIEGPLLGGGRVGGRV